MENTEALINLAAKTMGGKKQLADALDVSPQAIWKWQKSRIPSGRVLDLEKLSNISREQLRPDLYPGKSGT